MYENGKMRPAETIPGMRGRGIRENDRGGEFNSDSTIYHFVNITMYPQYNNNMFILITALFPVANDWLEISFVFSPRG
jgi:hypothetical protein